MSEITHVTRNYDPNLPPLVCLLDDGRQVCRFKDDGHWQAYTPDRWPFYKPVTVERGRELDAMFAEAFAKAKAQEEERKRATEAKRFMDRRWSVQKPGTQWVWLSAFVYGRWGKPVRIEAVTIEEGDLFMFMAAEDEPERPNLPAPIPSTKANPSG